MNILLTNDDGIFAPGIAAAYKELVKLGDVTVVAPADAMSGTGHGITVFKSFECEKVEVSDAFTGYSVSGSPADCVKLAILEICKEKIDLVVSGINNGANVGINVYYSGTVGAAMEAAFYKIPSVALSACRKGEVDLTNAAKHAVRVLKKLLPPKLPGVININVPQLNAGNPKGVKVVPQSTFGFSEHYVKEKDDAGKTRYQLTGGNYLDKAAPADTIALAEGFITVTALGNDMTDYKNMENLHQINWD